ncbi:MAG: PIN domain-containing protein [Chloroflexi bacterium]|nr:PIN domain-containing protein [Chloroflexota bacterium]
MARLILNTTILVAAERGDLFLNAITGGDDDVALAAVTAAEFLVGVEMADEAHQAQRRAYVEEILASLPVEPYDLEVARTHALLLAQTQRSGRPRGSHDLMIASTARARNRTVVTLDASGFEGLPGVEVRAI